RRHSSGRARRCGGRGRARSARARAGAGGDHGARRRGEGRRRGSRRLSRAAPRRDRAALLAAGRGRDRLLAHDRSGLPRPPAAPARRMSEIVPLLDAEGAFATVREAFGLDDDTPWNARFHVFLVRLPEAVVVVDTGVGSPSGGDPFLPERQGWLPDALAGAGANPADVDLVVLTHLHVDHVGWNMVDGEPYFPNARYVAHREDFDWVTATRGDRPYVRENVQGLAATGRLELVEGPAEPAPGVRLIRIG